MSKYKLPEAFKKHAELLDDTFKYSTHKSKRIPNHTYLVQHISDRLVWVWEETGEKGLGRVGAMRPEEVENL